MVDRWLIVKVDSEFPGGQPVMSVPGATPHRHARFSCGTERIRGLRRYRTCLTGEDATLGDAIVTYLINYIYIYIDI